MDDIDRACEREEKDRAIALAAARRTPCLPDTGRCHYCDASVPPGAHFCDVDCRDMFEHIQRMEKINAKR